MDTMVAGNSSTRNVRRKRSCIIDPVFQWRYTLLISGSVFFVSTFMTVILFAVLHTRARAMLVDPDPGGMWENTLIMLLSAVAFAAVTAGAVAFWSIFITHRVAGPIFVLERYLREISAGRLPKVRALRKKDEFKELHETFRKTVDTLENRYRADLATFSETLAIARSCAGQGEDAQRRALEQIACRMEGLRTQAAEILGEPLDDPPTGDAEIPEATSLSELPCAEVHA